MTFINILTLLPGEHSYTIRAAENSTPIVIPGAMEICERTPATATKTTESSILAAEPMDICEKTPATYI